MLSTSPASFHAHYKSLVATGAIEADPAQARAAAAFAALEQRLSGYKPVRKQSLLERLFGDNDEPPLRGLYVHGEVGRGKTMLMDLFFQQSPVAHKRRAHFHEFMVEVHERIYGYRQNIARGETTIHAIDDRDPERVALHGGHPERVALQGESSERIARQGGRSLGSFTLAEPFDAALVDDHRVAHGVTPVEPIDPAAPAHRDVLVVTFRQHHAD